VPGFSARGTTGKEIASPRGLSEGKEKTDRRAEDAKEELDGKAVKHDDGGR
jgi:hypothetical protein